ncbi:hypothetical protein ABW21_db0208319 [Orbilia brochopaga]|nr:hypothetical protein ABW21_db0208319 [Drechslerella brochopaga]
MASNTGFIPMMTAADGSGVDFRDIESMSVTSTFIGSDIGDDATFRTYYTLKYTGFGFRAPSIPIYQGNPRTSSTDTLSVPAYIISRANDKLQLVSGSSNPDRYTILAYHKNQKIEVRDSPELSAGSKELEMLAVDWPRYSPKHKPKLFNIRTPNGRIYAWIRVTDGIYKLVEKAKSKQELGSNRLIAKITEYPEAQGIVAVYLAEEEHDQDMENHGLDDDIVLVSAIGVLKRCEYEISQLGWYHGLGPSPRKNGFLSAYGLSGLGNAPGSVG